MNYKVDIFKLLSGMASNKMDALDDLTEAELKSVSPYVLQMWVKGADNNLENRLVLTNEFANQYMFSLGDHPKLLYRLLCYSNGFGQDTRFYFPKKKKTSSHNFTLKTLMKYYSYDERHASDIIPLLTAEDILTIGEELGYEKDDMKKLKNETKTI